MKPDINSRADIQLLVTSFYAKVKTDIRLAAHFSHVDWDHHLPVMFSFWESLLLGKGTYRGNPLQSHVKLALGRDDFETWLRLWNETVDEKFSGDVAMEAKSRAGLIAEMFQYKLGIAAYP